MNQQQEKLHLDFFKKKDINSNNINNSYLGIFWLLIPLLFPAIFVITMSVIFMFDTHGQQHAQEKPIKTAVTVHPYLHKATHR